MQTTIDFEFWDVQIKHFVDIYQSENSSPKDKEKAKENLIEIRARLSRDIKDLNIQIEELEAQL